MRLFSIFSESIPLYCPLPRILGCPRAVTNAESPLFAAGGRETVVALPSQVCARARVCICIGFHSLPSQIALNPAYTAKTNAPANMYPNQNIQCPAAIIDSIRRHLWFDRFPSIYLDVHSETHAHSALPVPLALSSRRRRRRRRLPLRRCRSQIGVDDCGRTPGRAVAALTAILQHRAPLAIVGPGCGAVVQV